MSLSIKKLPEIDLHKLADLHCRCVKKHPFRFFERYYKENPNLFVGCYTGNNMIGFVWGYERKNFVILEGIGVEPKYRRSKIGSKMLKFFENQVKKIGKSKISLGSAENTDKFYIENGYKPVQLLATVKGKKRRTSVKECDLKEREQIKEKLKISEAIYIFEKKLKE